MATFTTTQAAQIRMYLGYPDLYRYKDPRLESILGGDQISADALALIVVLLAQLQANDGLIYGTSGNPGTAAEAAGLKKIESIEFYQGQAIEDLRVVRQELATRLSNMLGVPFYGEAMGKDGYPGDAFSATGGLGRGGGNLIPLG